MNFNPMEMVAGMTAALLLKNTPDRGNIRGVRHMDPGSVTRVITWDPRAKRSTIAAVLAEAFGPRGVRPAALTEAALTILHPIWTARSRPEWVTTRSQVAGARRFALEIVRHVFSVDGSMNPTSGIRQIDSPSHVVREAVLVAYFAGSQDQVFGMAEDDSHYFITKVAFSLRDNLVVDAHNQTHPLDQLVACKAEGELAMPLNQIDRGDESARREVAELSKAWLEETYPGVIEQWAALHPVVMNAITIASILRRPEAYRSLTFDLLVACRLTLPSGTDRDCTTLRAEVDRRVEEWRKHPHPGRAPGRDADLDDWSRWWKAEDQEALAAEAILHVEGRPRTVAKTLATIAPFILTCALLCPGTESPAVTPTIAVDVGVMRQADDVPQSMPIDAPASLPEHDGGSQPQIADIGVMIKLADIGVMGSIMLADIGVMGSITLA